jgi:hypothetical protein
MPKAKTPPSARVARAKKERGQVIARRLKAIDRSKRRGSRGSGFTREDLEALRDGRA